MARKASGTSDLYIHVRTSEHTYKVHTKSLGVVYMPVIPAVSVEEKSGVRGHL